MAGSSPFTVMTNIFVTVKTFRENSSGNNSCMNSKSKCKRKSRCSSKTHLRLFNESYESHLDKSESNPILFQKGNIKSNLIGKKAKL